MVELDAQAWLSRRLGELNPTDFDENVHIYCTAQLIPPVAFENCWTVFRADRGEQPSLGLSTAALVSKTSVLVLSDPGLPAEVASLCQLVHAIDDLGHHDPPPIVWVPHGRGPDAGGETDIGSMQSADGFSKLLMETGVDAIVLDEPEDFRLAQAVQSRLRKLAFDTKKLGNLLNQRRERARQAAFLQDGIDAALWTYLRPRIAGSIPPVDRGLPTGLLAHIDGYEVAHMLGRGMFGSVYLIRPGPDIHGWPDQVLKAVEKAGMTELTDLGAMKRQIEIMRLISSDRWRHPNVIRMHQVYHSPSHVFFRMEFGGFENLFRRLRARERPTPTTTSQQLQQQQQQQEDGDRQRLPQQPDTKNLRPLSLEHATSMIHQACSAVTHLHLGPLVCHRDIKPENFIVNTDVHGSPLVKLADFDLATIHNQTAMCRTICGTMPFTAPEVMLKQSYNGLAADIWSLGVVLMEVLCGVRILERALSLTMCKPEKGPDTEALRLIARVFEERPAFASDVVEERCRDELRQIAPASKVILQGMLTIDVDQRWNAEQLSSSMHHLESDGGGV